MIFDDTAERATLAGMLVSGAAVADAVEVLRAPDFDSRAHGVIFDAIVDLYSHGEPTDVVATVDQLMRTGRLAEAGGAAYVHELTSSPGVPEAVSHYALVVAEQSTLRCLASTAERIGDIARSGRGDATEIARWAAEKVNEIAVRQWNGGQQFATTLDAAIEEMEFTRGHTGGCFNVESGLAELDALTGGLRPGELTIIAGGTGAGKTMLALNIIRQSAFVQGFPSLMFSLELSRSEISARITSAQTDVPMNAIRNGRLDARAWTSLAAFRQQHATAPLHIDDRLNLTVDDIRLAGRQRRTRGGLNLIVVDHLQLVEGGARVSRELKVLARELRVPVVAVSQLDALGGVPREAAQDADIVLVLREGTLGIVKHRHGATATIPVSWEPDLARFVDGQLMTVPEERTAG